MAYQPPDRGQYVSPQQQPGQPPPASSYGSYSPQKLQPYPQVVLPPLNPYPQPQAQFQAYGHPTMQSYQLPPFPMQHSAPPPAVPIYDGAYPSYYVAPNPASGHPYPYPQYSQQLPPRSQSQPQPPPPPRPIPPTQVYPPAEIQSPPIRQQQRAASDFPRYSIPQVVITSASPRSLQRVGSASAKDTGRQHGNGVSNNPPADFQALLLALADEYLDAAHNQGASLAISGQRLEIEEYFKLIATALGCLEAVLKMKKSKLQPRTEALVRLQYAKILFEETENDMVAETALTKGIDLCDRNKMFDIKYSMQQLLCRILFKSNPKAAMKAVDGVINDAEAYRHTGWEYAFRLLRVSLSITSSQYQDSVAALHNLQKLSAIAERNGDRAILVVSAIMEAFVLLRQSSNPDAIEHAQRAIAAARTHQLDPSIHDIPQIQTIIQMVDICCSLLEYDINQAHQKLQAMQRTMDQNINDPHWLDDGSFSLPLRFSNVSESGDVLRLENGTVKLTLSWLAEHDLYALCYFLSSVTLCAKNSQDGHKSEKFLSEGLRMVQSSLKKPHDVTESIMSANSRLQWRRMLHCNMLLQQVFLACSRTDWKLASGTLEKLQQAVQDIDDDNNDTIKCLMEYARGVIAQATGDPNEALAIFQQPIFSLDRSTNKTSRNNPRHDIAILAGLNTVLIFRDPYRQSQINALRVLTNLEPFCRACPSKYVQAAYSLISATIQTESTIQTKRDLHQALQAAMAISNSQVTCLALTFMSWKYFRGVVGEQSEKSAKAARAMARKADDKLWMSVTEELLAETLDRQGKASEARAARVEADKILEHLPLPLKKMKKTGLM